MVGHHAHLGVAYTLDATPWVHLLNDGRPHTFGFQMGNSFGTFWWVGVARGFQGSAGILARAGMAA